MVAIENDGRDSFPGIYSIRRHKFCYNLEKLAIAVLIFFVRSAIRAVQAVPAAWFDAYCGADRLM